MSRRIRVHGRVQGVWFRGWSVDHAHMLGLSGWVRNRRDGSVEILAEGSGEALAALVELCRRGPPAARVERVEIEETDEAPPPGFAQLPTA